jgi:hypothetical protein
MKSFMSRPLRLAAGAAALALVSLLVLGPMATLVRGKIVDAQPSAQLVELGFKFEGAATCSNAKCHGAAEAAEAPKPPGNEYNVWVEKDRHALAHEHLTKPDVEKNPAFANIARNLGIADAATDARCTSCHSLAVPAELQGQKFSIREGITCNACHGPSEKWNTPHAEIGWTQKQREATGSHAALLKQWGLYDTKPVIARAEKCTSCHLAIDPTLVAAGHPQPIFELDYYSELENKHWRDPEGYFSAKLWAAGQVICLRDAMRQLAERAASGAPDPSVKDATDQALGHYMVLKPLLATKAIPGVDGAALDAAVQKLQASAGDNAAIAPAATAAADAAGRMADAFNGFEPDRKTTLTLLNAIAADSSIHKDATLHGVEQQAFAIYSLYNTFARVETPADADATIDAIAALFAPVESRQIDSAAYTRDLQQVQAKLPKN